MTHHVMAHLQVMTNILRGCIVVQMVCIDLDNLMDGIWHSLHLAWLGWLVVHETAWLVWVCSTL